LRSARAFNAEDAEEYATVHHARSVARAEDAEEGQLQCHSFVVILCVPLRPLR
jgi:hypothetical protein